MQTALISWLLLLLAVAVASQPLFGLEKQLLYSFQDPDEFEVIPQKRVPLLNLFGPNSRFTDPFRNRIYKKKIRSVQPNDPILLPCGKEECPYLYK
ncbi:unnamed protein product [Caenorhabditis auriculariae]|uniref:Uncharacterized protein n=1 Tax=Caenorhabditis auriculariae TaxID=2777116 RepID=A0A8S1H9Q3_9PELO|nr:unnamed protein product [Caenorhabditis auriculariae]